MGLCAVTPRPAVPVGSYPGCKYRAGMTPLGSLCCHSHRGILRANLGEPCPSPFTFCDVLVDSGLPCRSPAPDITSLGGGTDLSTSSWKMKCDGHLGLWLCREAFGGWDTEQTAPCYLPSRHTELRLRLFLSGHCFIRISCAKQS